jgi:hypothetical protein
VGTASSPPPGSPRATHTANPADKQPPPVTVVGSGVRGPVRVCGSNTTHTRVTGAGPRAVLPGRGVLSLHLEMITARSERAGAARPSCHRQKSTFGVITYARSRPEARSSREVGGAHEGSPLSELSRPSDFRRRLRARGRGSPSRCVLSEGSAAGRVGAGGGFPGDVTARGSGPDPVAGSPGIGRVAGLVRQRAGLVCTAAHGSGWAGQDSRLAHHRRCPRAGL